MSAQFFNCARLYYIEFDFDIYERADVGMKRLRRKYMKMLRAHDLLDRMYMKKRSASNSFEGCRIWYTGLR